MTNQEKVLGIIRNADGGTSLWDEMEYLIYPTNARVIFVEIGDPGRSMMSGTDDLRMIMGELMAEKLSSESPDKILSSRKSNFAISHNDLDSLEITKGNLRTSIIFYWRGQKYKFKVPNNQYQTVRRWEEIYKRFKKLQICPDCGNKLKEPLKYCERCNKNIEIFSSDLRANYIKEKELEITKNVKPTGIIIILTGFIMIFMIIAAFYPILGNEILFLGIICFPIPFLFIIVGVLVYIGRISAKLYFGVLFIIFGAMFFITGAANIVGSTENGGGGGYAMAMGVIIFSYGYYLIRNTLRRRTSDNS